MPIVHIPTEKIVDEASFHQVFAEIMGFPGFYGRNMNAWIDCMGYCDVPEEGMSQIHCIPPDVVTLHFENISNLIDRCPDVYDSLVECTAFVNYRRTSQKQNPVLALSFYK